MTTLEGKLLERLDQLTAAVERLEQRLSQPEPELLSIEQVATKLDVCTKTVRRLIARRQLAARRIGTHWKVAAAEVRRFSQPSSPAPTSKRRSEEPYDARAEYEKGMRRLGGRAR